MLLKVFCLTDPMTFSIMVQSMLCCNFPSHGNVCARQGDGCSSGADCAVLFSNVLLTSLCWLEITFNECVVILCIVLSPINSSCCIVRTKIIWYSLSLAPLSSLPFLLLVLKHKLFHIVMCLYRYLLFLLHL